MDAKYKGYLEIENREFAFFIDGNQLHLLTLDKKPHNFRPYERIEYECVYGQLTNGNLICLIGVVIHAGFLHTMTGGVAAIVEGTRNMGNYITIEPFDSILFKGEIVNRFYWHFRVIDQDKTNEFCEDGSGVIAFKPYEATKVKHKVKIVDKDAEIVLATTHSTQAKSKSETFVKVHSSFDIRLNEQVDCSEIKNIYQFTANFFKLCNFRKSIDFDEIILRRKNDEGLYEKVAKLLLLTEKEKALVDIHNTISYEDICDNFSKVFENVNKSDRYTLFVPNSDKESNTVDYLSYINTSACFEYFYSKLYKSETLESVAIDECKDEIIQAINSIKHERIEEIKSYIEEYRLDNKTLKIKFKEVFKKHKLIVKEVFPRLTINSKAIDDIAQDFAEQRNRIAHGNTDSLQGLYINPYVIVLCLLYIMILEESEVSSEKIIQITKKIFSRYLTD